jgi:prophage regulatory protein
MNNHLAVLIGKVAELHGRSMAISARMRHDAQLLTEVHHELTVDLNTLWELLRMPRPTTPVSPPEAQRILRLAEVAKRVGLGKSSVWAMVKDGRFPAPKRLSQRAVGWSSAEIDSWLMSREVLGHEPRTGRPRSR